MKKGFTLVELLAVLAILAVLAVLVVPPVMKNIQTTREASFNQILSNIEQTTQLYVRENRNNIEGLSVVGNTVTITIQDLVNKEDLKTPIIDPRNNKEIDLSTPINVLVKPQSRYSVVIGNIIYVGDAK